ncbi:efflux RND transporter periplasmic adaptor subunit [Pseudothermotoga sp.]|nr:efflux RND transporter periplasmic adaptor subunit [Pseudothermotoga sp.]MCX7812209.1 efflux RND transporter periplasmic adaptor subunit [Pseudothermotoga sp.]MDW8139279.1 efflux RND transporter periplasmic adaptor subunit [Pseudothermotoga sp.]
MHKLRLMLVFLSFIFILTACSNRNTVQTTTVQVSEYTVSKMNLIDTVTLSGTVQAREYADIRTLVSGIVKKVLVNKGDQVKAGDVLVEIDDTEYKLAYIKALQNYETAKNSGSKLLIQQREIELELAKRDLENCKIVSPISGVVTSLDVKQGDLVNTGKTLARVVNLEKLYISASVDEVDYSKIAVGQVATVSFDAIEGLRLGARVSYVSSVAETSGGIVVVPIELDVLNLDISQLSSAERSQIQQVFQQFRNQFQGMDQAQVQQRLQQLRNQLSTGQRPSLGRASIQAQTSRVIPGLSCEVNIVTLSKENVIAVPVNAVKFVSGKSYVTVKKKDGTTEDREISVGVRTSNFYEVLSGLAEGEVVLVTGRTTSANRTSQTFGPIPGFGPGPTR